MNNLNSFQKWNIGTIVRDIILSDSGSSGYVGENIFPIVAPENIVGDFIVYRRDTYKKDETKMGVHADICNLALVVISDNYDRAIEIADYLDNLLTGRHYLSATDTRFEMQLIDSEENYTDNKYMEILMFKID